MEDQNKYIQFTIKQLIDTWKALSECISQHPDKLIQHQLAYWQAYIELCQDSTCYPNHLLNEKNNVDKRFNYKDWQESISFSFIKRSYLLLSDHINALIKDITKDTNEKKAKKSQFYTQQFINAFSPTNFANLNPEILSKTLETKGINLITGMQQLLKDLENGQNFLNIKTADIDIFKLGENIACTPGKVIYQNDLIQLIQYTASTEKIHPYPLLIIPPWINKYYILDLQQENSLVKWLVEQGLSVFLISWINPGKQYRQKEFSDYMIEGPLAALQMIKEITHNTKVNTLGYCIGGTLLGCTLAYLAKKNKVDLNIQSATFLTTLFDFSEPGDLGIFMGDNELTMLEKEMETKGYLDGRIMASVFNALRANDLIWLTFINHYLKGEKQKPFDLLYWNADSTNIPMQVHRFYLRKMYLENSLIKPNKLELAGIPLDLSSIQLPSYFLAAQEDHIVPWQSAYKSSQFYGGTVKFVLTTSGHVAGVINPPHQNKYGYWTHVYCPKNPETYLSSANFTQGSWWNNWIKWLKKYSGKKQSIESLDIKKYKIIEKAPGSYVKVKLTEIE